MPDDLFNISPKYLSSGELEAKAMIPTESAAFWMMNNPASPFAMTTKTGASAVTIRLG